MSAIEPTGMGARTAIPSNRPSYWGSARVVASAAPVVAGTRFAAAARPRRKCLLGPSTIDWRRGIGVHGRHHRLLEADAPADDLDDRRDAVRRATRAGDDAGRALRGVRAVDHRLHVAALRRRRQEDEPRPGPDVLLEILAPRERAGALEHEIDAKLLPREIQRVAAPQRPQLCVRRRSGAPPSTTTGFG